MAYCYGLASVIFLLWFCKVYIELHIIFSQKRRAAILNSFIYFQFNSLNGGPRGRVVKVADFSALNHSIISPLWVRASLGARVTCGTSQVLLAGVSGGFSPGTPVFAPPTD